MPLPVRVDPLGALHAVPDRGAAFGNRGILHAPDGTVVRGWGHRAWIVCATTFGDHHRAVMPPDRYTGLFFRDEATALAAGHRPCFACRRADATAFAEAWAVADGGGRNGRAPRPLAGEIDRALHAERLLAGARPRAGAASQRRLPPIPGDAADLPEGTVVLDTRDVLLVVHGGELRPWAFGALGAPAAPTGGLRLVTPPSTLAVLRAGYRPTTHPLVA